jgi:hypothetical protein
VAFWLMCEPGLNELLRGVEAEEVRDVLLWEVGCCMCEKDFGRYEICFSVFACRWRDVTGLIC